MAFGEWLLLFILTIGVIPFVFSDSIIKFPSEKDVLAHRKVPINNALFCDSWRLSVETNNAGIWEGIPTRCQQFVEEYMTGERYLSDSEVIASLSLSFSKSVRVARDGKDAWVFDIDETLLSNVPYYEAHGFGSEIFDEASFDKWVDQAEAPALPASLRLYQEVQRMGFKIFLLTGRSEHQRNATEANLVSAGYTNWDRLILRGISDKGKSATSYKSEKRGELVNEGFRIQGSSGDQWSDLLGFALATRSFKLPNPIYFIP